MATEALVDGERRMKELVANLSAVRDDLELISARVKARERKGEIVASALRDLRVATVTTDLARVLLELREFGNVLALDEVTVGSLEEVTYNVQSLLPELRKISEAIS